MLWAVLIIFSVLITVYLIYCLFCFFRYLLKKSALKKKVKALQKSGWTVEFQKPIGFLRKIGETNFIVSRGEKRYSVSVLTHPSLRARWNIEKARNDHFYFGVYIYSKIFYGLYNNSGTEPEHSKDLRREWALKSKRLYLTRPQEEEEKLLLIYPKPREVTYTEASLNYVAPGMTLLGYRILYAEDFWALFEGQNP